MNLRHEFSSKEELRKVLSLTDKTECKIEVDYINKDTGIINIADIEYDSWLQLTNDMKDEGILKRVQKSEVEIPITEYDLELFKDLIYNNAEPIEWTIKNARGVEITLIFKKEE